MSCRAELPDGRARRFDITAAAVMAENRRVQNTDIETSMPEAEKETPASPAQSSRAREICISASIFIAVIGAIGVIVAIVN